MLHGRHDRFLNTRGFRIFDYPRFAERLRDVIRARARELADAAGIELEHISKAQNRKEGVVGRALERRGDQVGPANVASAMEACPRYKPWHDKGSGETFLKPATGKSR